MDGPETSAVSRRHVLVERLDGRGSRHLTVLLVHIVGARSRIIADPNTEVLNLKGTFLMDLVVDACLDMLLN